MGPGSAAQRRSHDKRLGAGTMSGSGAECPSCGSVTKMAELRLQGRSRAGSATRMTAVVIDGQAGKEYRAPTAQDIDAATVGPPATSKPSMPTCRSVCRMSRPRRLTLDASRACSVGAVRVRLLAHSCSRTASYLALGTFVRGDPRDPGRDGRLPGRSGSEALAAYLACTLSKLTDYSSAICSWHNGGEKLGHTFARFALPMVWDFCEVNPLSATTGGFNGDVGLGRPIRRSRPARCTLGRIIGGCLARSALARAARGTST